MFGADIKKMGVWSIVLYQDFLKGIPKAKIGPHSHTNMKQCAIFGVTEPTLDEASVAPHYINNGTALIMVWWLPGLSFSVDTVLGAQHRQVRIKTNAKLSTLESVFSKFILLLYLRKDQETTLYLSNTNPQVQSVRVCQDSLHANAVDIMPLRSQES